MERVRRGYYMADSAIEVALQLYGSENGCETCDIRRYWNTRAGPGNTDSELF